MRTHARRSWLDLDEAERATIIDKQIAARVAKIRAGRGPTYLGMTPAEREAFLERQQQRRVRDIAGGRPT